MPKSSLLLSEENNVKFDGWDFADDVTEAVSIEENDHAYVIEDFTCSSPWEKFIAHIEETIRSWGLDTTANYVEPASKDTQIYFMDQTFTLSLYSRGLSNFEERHLPKAIGGLFQAPSYDLYDISAYFGVHFFLTIHPQSPLNESEAALLLSSLSIATSSVSIPVFVPVEDRSASIYIGRFEGDLISTQFKVQKARKPPKQLRYLSGLQQYFDEQIVSLCISFNVKELDKNSMKTVKSSSQIHAQFGFTRGIEKILSIRSKQSWRDFSLPSKTFDLPWGNSSFFPPLQALQLEISWPFFPSGKYVENPLYSDFEPQKAESWYISASWGTFDASNCPMHRCLSNIMHIFEKGALFKSFRDIRSDKLSSVLLSISEGPLMSIEHVDQELDVLFSLESEKYKRVFDRSTAWGSLLSLFVMRLMLVQSLGMFGLNLRTFVVFWERFVRRVRKFWDTGSSIPLTNDEIDLNNAVVYQKLQLLQKCLSKSPIESDISQSNPDGVLESSEINLLHSSEPLFIPRTQKHPPVTSDTLEQHQQLFESLGTSREASRLRAQLQGHTVLSDMQCFKAANPACRFEDFVRWYSPNDFVDGMLSERMDASGNLWKELWNDAKAVPFWRQAPLFNKQKEAELALDYLETISPENLFKELSIIAVENAIGALKRAISDSEGYAMECITKCENLVKSGETITFLENFQRTEWVCSKFMALKAVFGSSRIIEDILRYQGACLQNEDRIEVEPLFDFETPSSKRFKLIGLSDVPGHSSIEIPHTLYVETNSEPSNFLFATAWSSIDV